MGLFDLFRRKPPEDPILGGLTADRISHTRTQTHTVVGDQVDGMDPADLMRELQAAAGDPSRMVERLRELYPDAQISVTESSSSDPAVFGAFGSMPPPAADPIAQLERLAALRASGALTEAEFAAAKAKLLGS